MLAMVVVAVIAMRILLFNGTGSDSDYDLHLIAMAIATALFIQITLSTTLGGVLPILARVCKLDPAVLVSPVLASIVDISGIWIYFTVVNHFLGLS